jgi:hypothetical protein
MKPLKSVVLCLSMSLASSSLGAPWAEWSSGPTDADLEAVVRIAYVAATKRAKGNLNYFARDDDFDELRGVVETQLAREGWGEVDVPVDPAADATALKACSPAGIAVRLAVNMFGDGITVAAASPERVFSYHYDPHEDAAIVVAPSADCAK